MLPVPNAAATEPMPIWMAALIASDALSGVRWECLAGRAVHTNRRAKPVVLESLGVRVKRGQSVVVTWRPGETEYTVELYDRCAAA